LGCLLRSAPPAASAIRHGDVSNRQTACLVCIWGRTWTNGDRERKRATSVQPQANHSATSKNMSQNHLANASLQCLRRHVLALGGK
jgi:hypothetical protein